MPSRMRRLVASVAIITRRLSSEAARVNGASSPSPRVPPQRRPHMGAKRRRTQTSCCPCLLSAAWVNCALTGSHQIITLVQPPPPLAAARGLVVHAQPLDGMPHRDTSTSPFTSLPTPPTAVLLLPTSTPSLRRCAWESGSLLNGDHILLPATVDAFSCFVTPCLSKVRCRNSATTQRAPKAPSNERRIPPALRTVPCSSAAASAPYCSVGEF
jgi:hypothetical protein